MHGKTIFAPLQLPNNARLLDIGCGTGCVTVELAEANPSAHVIGIGLAGEPTRSQRPANVQYVKGDFLECAKDGQLQPGSFDFMFSRLLACGVTRWPDYVV